MYYAAVYCFLLNVQFAMSIRNYAGMRSVTDGVVLLQADVSVRDLQTQLMTDAVKQSLDADSQPADINTHWLLEYPGHFLHILGAYPIALNNRHISLQPALLQQNIAMPVPDVPLLARTLGKPLLVVPVLLGFAMLVLILFSMVDFKGKPHELQQQQQQQQHQRDGSPKKMWSVASIMALTSYRFYTGFLSATWMPYLLAMEGHALMNERQSFFMGSAKLIYGMSILLNPVFGLVGDQMTVISQWSGRRLFVLIGVGLGGLGIYGCMVAAEMHSSGWYLTAVVLWMLGEAMADVTTETVVPELLPRSQYGISSSIRALNFLLGGLAGYSMLIVFRHRHYSWLYYGYLVLMLTCAFLTLLTCANAKESKSEHKPQSSKDIAIVDLFKQAYVVPCQLTGGFPLACTSSFVFSLGSAPMFFLFLMVRDLVGLTSNTTVQTHFSAISIVFFVAAAVASILMSAPDEGSNSENNVVAGPEAAAGAGSQSSPPAESQQVVEHRWRMMIIATVSFGTVTLCIPLVALFPTKALRLVCFYIVACLFGLAFGTVYARFQECTWSLLPPCVDVANAMGFAAMCKLAGVGLGNFFAGIVLDVYSLQDGRYQYSGYVILCLFCALVVFSSAVLTNKVLRHLQTNVSSTGGV